MWDIIEGRGGNWRRWIDVYYLKGVSFWRATCKNSSSWIWKNILKLRDEVVLLFGSADDVERHLRNWGRDCSFRLHEAYDAISSKGEQIGWKRTLWEGLFVPKHRVILWFALHNGLATIENMNRRGWEITNRCSL